MTQDSIVQISSFPLSARTHKKAGRSLALLSTFGPRPCGRPSLTAGVGSREERDTDFLLHSEWHVVLSPAPAASTVSTDGWVTDPGFRIADPGWPGRLSGKGTGDVSTTGCVPMSVWLCVWLRKCSPKDKCLACMPCFSFPKNTCPET